MCIRDSISTVYITTIGIVIITMTFYVLREYLNIYTATITLTIFFSTTVILGLIFIPKVCIPHGLNSYLSRSLHAGLQLNLSPCMQGDNVIPNICYLRSPQKSHNYYKWGMMHTHTPTSRVVMVQKKGIYMCTTRTLNLITIPHETSQLILTML